MRFQKQTIKIFMVLALALAAAASYVSAQTHRKAIPKDDTHKGYVVEKPDLEKIREETLNPRSKYYYPTLYKRYMLNDTTKMTPEDFRHLYLGYMFQEDYDPYRVSPYTEVTDALREKTTHSKAEIDTIEKYALLSLDDNPFDLRQMSFLIHVLKESKKFARAKIWEYRLENILRAIRSTGSGDNAENAWYVVYPTHEYDLIQLLGFRATDVDFPEDGVIDQLFVEKTGTTKLRTPDNGFFFNVKIPTEQYELKHPEELIEETEESIPAEE